MDLSLIDIQNIESEWLTNNQLSLDVLRLDKIDPVVSGNKWFKLKYYLANVDKMKKTAVATFGGAWSNHILATAFAAKEAGVKSIGIIRGEKPAVLSYTLATALEYGMQLHFVSRSEYQQKEDIKKGFASEDWYWIEEGGYGVAGARGAAEIMQTADLSEYSYIIAAVGTGTMLAGLVNGSNKNQQVIGISSMKGNYSIEQKINELLNEEEDASRFVINHDYHFGGYGKHPDSLISFINDVYQKHLLPLDIVYTGKTFYAIKDMAEKKFFKQGSKLLMIHSGGLQGNMSLTGKVLAF